jgi:hypothetical protein
MDRGGLKKNDIIQSALCTAIFLLLFSSCGNYFFIQFYDFHDISVEQLVNRIDTFKNKYPEYKLIRVSSEGIYGEYPDTYEKNYYNLYFHFKDTDQTLHCIILDEPTIIGLDAVSQGTNFGGWKDINTVELTREENDRIKKKFETEILNQLGKWKRVDDSEGFKRIISRL